MDEYKDIIEDIYPDITNEKNITITKDLNLYEIVAAISPGTEIRKGLDEILKANLGAIIVLGQNVVLDSIIRGGFKLDNDLKPTTIFELGKMDGAIVVSNDLKKIIYANIHLMPDKSIESTETGIRHRSAEQTAKQTGLPVIAISQRRSVISLYYKKEHYILENLPYLISKADHYLRTIANYRQQIDSHLNELTYYELNNNSTYEDALRIMQKIIFLEKQKLELEKTIIELGTEGTQIKQSLFENTYGLRSELSLLFMDYTQNKDNFELLLEQSKAKEVVDLQALANILEVSPNILDDSVKTKGYRVLSKIPKVSKSTIEKIILEKGSLFDIYLASKEELVESAMISEKQAELVKEQLNRINDTIMNKIYKN